MEQGLPILKAQLLPVVSTLHCQMFLICSAQILCVIPEHYFDFTENVCIFALNNFRYIINCCSPI
jgi:hypothetical protein